MKILFFSSVAELTGCSTIEIPACDSIETLKGILEEQFPALKNVQYSFAINQRITHSNQKLSEQDTIALLPPFSGG